MIAIPNEGFMIKVVKVLGEGVGEPSFKKVLPQNPKPLRLR